MYSYITMIRTQISLHEEQHRRLKEQSRETGLSMSELVRRQLDGDELSTEERQRRLRALRASFGAWGDRDFDGREYVEQIRSGQGIGEKYGPFDDE